MVENLHSVREEERTSGRSFIEEEQLLFFSNSQVVTALSLFQELQVLGHGLLIGKSDTTDTLQRIVALVTKEVGR